MPGSGLPAREADHSEVGVRAGITQQEAASLPGAATGNQLADGYSVPLPREAPHSPAMNKITTKHWLPFGSLTDLLKGRSMRPAC